MSFWSLLGVLCALIMAAWGGLLKDLQGGFNKYLSMTDYNSNTRAVAAAMDQFYHPGEGLRYPVSHNVEYASYLNGNQVTLYTPQNVAGTFGAVAGDMLVPFVCVAYFVLTLMTVGVLVTKSVAAWNGVLKKYQVEKEVNLPWPFSAAEWDVLSRRILASLEKYHDPEIKPSSSGGTKH